MEIDTRAATFGAQDGHPVQKKLTQVYKVTKSSPLAESKSKAGNARLQQAGVEVCPLPALVVVKPEPVEVCPLPTPVVVKPEPVEYNGSLIPESTASHLHQESTILTQIPIPGAAPGLQKVKRELLSPSSCITNATEDVVASNGVESLATAHANPMGSGCLPPAEPELLVASTPLVALSDEAALAVTILVMTQEPPKPETAELAENPVTVAEATTLTTASPMLPATLEVDVELVESTPAPIVSPASECALRSVKSEPVACPPLRKPSVVKEELLLTTTLVMSQEPPKHPSTEPETAEPAENLVTQAATSTKLISASPMVPAKLEVDVELVESTPAPIASPASECALRSVKSEPVACPPLRKPSVVKEELLLTTTLVMSQEPPKHPNTEPETAEPTENLVTQVESTPAPIAKPALLPVKTEPLPAACPPLRKPIVVKEEVLTSPLERNRSGVFTQPAAAAVTSSESEDDSEEDSEEDVVQETQIRRSQYVGNSQTETKLRNSKPGFRIQGGRVYDSEFGITCHWCRQKTVEHHVKCRQCTTHFCGPCLLNRNGENVRQELCEGVRWLCPKCRHGCGPGCDNCCNCGPCRKALGLSPTGHLIGQARNVGFGNVHDYLVHLETGESATKIARRKRGQGWTNEGRFECESLESSDSDADVSSSSDGGDDLTLDEVTSSQLHQGLLGMKFVRKFVKSQKRKRVVTPAPLPVKKNRVEVWHSVHNVAARMRGSQPSPKVTQPKVAELSFVKEEEAEVTPACQTVVQNSETPEQCTDVSGLLTKTCKREHVECNDGSDLETSVKRQKLTGDQQSAASNDLRSPFACKEEPISANVDTPGAQGGSSLVSESEVLSKVNRAHAVNNGVSSSSSPTMSEQQRVIECPTDSQGTDFRMKLKAALAQSFDAKELEELDCSVRCRKPVLKLRHMRGRVIDVVTEEDGLSYLDHHQDFSTKLEEAQSPPGKLALLRGFFFWLQHSCMEGAFRPWPRALAKFEHQSGDCIETEGPDCQVTAVVLQLDEANEAQPLINRTLINPVERPTETTSIPFGSHSSQQSLIPYPARKISSQPEKPKMRSQVQSAANYQVVLGLPALTLGKI